MLFIVILIDKTVGRGKKDNQILGVSEVIHGLLTEQWSAPLTPTFFKGWLYSEFLLMCKNFLIYENIEEKVFFPHESSSNSQERPRLVFPVIPTASPLMLGI